MSYYTPNRTIQRVWKNNCEIWLAHCYHDRTSIGKLPLIMMIHGKGYPKIWFPIQERSISDTIFVFGQRNEIPLEYQVACFEFAFRRFYQTADTYAREQFKQKELSRDTDWERLKLLGRQDVEV